MSKLMSWLRSFGPIGTFISTVLAILTANWAVVVSAVGGIIAALWTSAFYFFQQSAVQIGIGVFLASLWTIIGVIVLTDRRKPRLVRSYQDYRYGLTFEGMFPLLEKDNEEGALQFSLQLRNYSMGPIQYAIEHFDVRIGTRALPKWEGKDKRVYMPRGAGRTSGQVPFKKDDIKEFFGKRVMGTAEFSIAYGHPEESPVRRLTMILELTIAFNENALGFNANILEEKDEPFNTR